MKLREKLKREVLRAMSKRVLITSALPYANGPLHFGHIAGAYLPGDVYARFERLAGSEVLYLCGSDEYGMPITIHAEKEGRTPQAHVDIYHAINKAFFEKLSFSFDNYSRTTWEGHKESVQQYFLDLLENGYIEERVTDQLYSEKDGRFLADRYVEGTCPKCGFQAARGDECPKCGASYEASDLKNPRSKVSGAPLSLKPTRHWFLRFDLFKESLSKWIADKQWKPNVVNFARAYIDDLRARAITRDSTWGVPIPLEGTEGKVFYVWFDAPIGYISAARQWAHERGDPDAWKRFWCDKSTELVHFVGKDNIPFHAVFFPAMTMGQNAPYKIVDQLPANEFLNLEGRKFSKSENWTIDLERFFHHFTTDQIRYYLAASAPESQDAEFTWREFQMRCNAELLGKYGNLANRILIFARKHCEGRIPPFHPKEEERIFLDKIHTLAAEIHQAYSQFSLRRAAALIMELATAGNVYFDTKKPWQLAKDPAACSQMQTCIALCITCLQVLSLVSSPIIPKTAQKLWELIGNHSTLETLKWKDVMEQELKVGTQLPPSEPLFEKVEDALIAKEEELLRNNLPKEGPSFDPLKEQIQFDTFLKLDLRVGKIVSAESIPKSKKLLKLQVDIGLEVRQIVSGIREFFPKCEELVGKKVVVVANLKPAKLMGIESQGMILASACGDALELVELSSADLGSVIS